MESWAAIGQPMRYFWTTTYFEFTSALDGWCKSQGCGAFSKDDNRPWTATEVRDVKRDLAAAKPLKRTEAEAEHWRKNRPAPRKVSHGSGR